MFEDTARQSQYQLANGATVYDAVGDKVGTVVEHDQQAGYMVVEKGWLFHRDIYIPLSAINMTDENGIYLQLYKDDLKDEQFSSPPLTQMPGDFAQAGTNATADGYPAADSDRWDAAKQPAGDMAGVKGAFDDDQATYDDMRKGPTVADELQQEDRAHDESATR